MPEGGRRRVSAERYRHGSGQGVFGVFPEFETNLRRECQLAGIMPSVRRLQGRKRSIDADQVVRLRRGRLRTMAIAHRLELAGQVSPAGGSHLGKRGWQ